METNAANEQMSKDMKRRGQKEHSKQVDKQNKFIFRSKHAMIHLKYYWFYIVRKIVLCVCVRVCASNTTKHN